MSDIIMVFFLQNVLIFSLIFWALTWGGEYFLRKKIQTAKSQFYECGFRSLSDVNVQINMNFSLLCVFLILYDIEFTLLFPILFNFGSSTFLTYFVFLIFVFFIILSLYFDLQFNALSWQL